jgi:hypothetical protein
VKKKKAKESMGAEEEGCHAQGFAFSSESSCEEGGQGK